MKIIPKRGKRSDAFWSYKLLMRALDRKCCVERLKVRKHSPVAEDPSDHISVETGFAGFLSLEEVYARLSQNDDAVAVTRNALQHFFEEHMARLARDMARKLNGLGPDYLNGL